MMMVINRNEYYISGKFALNIRKDNDPTFGDWHGSIWDGIVAYPDDRITHYGKFGKADTNMIWANYGLYEGKHILYDSKRIKTNLDKVYIATHIRAILDMVYYYLTEFGRICEVDFAAHDFLLDKGAITEMLVESKKITGYLDSNQLKKYKKWCKVQRNELKEL